MNLFKYVLCLCCMCYVCVVLYVLCVCVCCMCVVCVVCLCVLLKIPLGLAWNLSFLWINGSATQKIILVDRSSFTATCSENMYLKDTVMCCQWTNKHLYVCTLKGNVKMKCTWFIYREYGSKLFPMNGLCNETHCPLGANLGHLWPLRPCNVMRHTVLLWELVEGLHDDVWQVMQHHLWADYDLIEHLGSCPASHVAGCSTAQTGNWQMKQLH